MKEGEKMDEAAFEARLNELVNEISTIPQPEREKLIKLAQKTRDCHQELKKSVDKLGDSLDYLRVSIKYLMFDLEATRRENSYLKKLLEESGHQ